MRAIAATVATLFLTVPAFAQSEHRPDPVNVEMTPGMVRLLEVERPIALVIIGDPDVADTQVLGQTGLSITALDEGDTSILILDDQNKVIVSNEVKVVSSERGLNRKTRTVRTFGVGGGSYATHTYYCDKSRENAPCTFASTKGNIAPRPIISTGPVLTTQQNVTQINMPNGAGGGGESAAPSAE